MATLRTNQTAQALVLLAIVDLVQLIPVTIVQALVAAPLLFLLPGWALWSVLDAPGTLSSDIARLSLSTVLSIALWPLSILVLAALSIGVTRASVLILFNVLILGLLTLPFAIRRLWANQTSTPRPS
ncbi:MAG TPA: DUF1616 domain-containing protein [Solirubrobacteraceae bacterium]|jgi:uncharacterized membrane protein|nr:DUF1616 domain-containing protein [Solirubrobacteraceae bacterium]